MGAKIGSFRNLALEQRSNWSTARAVIRRCRGHQVQGGGTTANINGRYGTDEQHGNGTVKLDEQALPPTILVGSIPLTMAQPSSLEMRVATMVR